MADEQNKTFNFELVSPERILVSEPAWQVTIPGEEGTFGVRAGHMSLMASIRPGVVEVVSQQGEAPKKIFISGGFADVTATNCTVLAEEAVNVNELSVPALEKELSDLRDDLAAASDQFERLRIERKADLARAKLAAVTGQRAA